MPMILMLFTVVTRTAGRRLGHVRSTWANLRSTDGPGGRRPPLARRWPGRPAIGVCLAVWLCFAAHTVSGKILAIVFPISAFVALGFEHSIANIYFLSYGLALKEWAQPEFWAAIGQDAAAYAGLTVSGAIRPPI